MPVRFESSTVKFDDDERPDGLTINKGGAEQAASMEGLYTYYYSFGLDAEVAYRWDDAGGMIMSQLRPGT